MCLHNSRRHCSPSRVDVSVGQPDLHCEMLARVTELDGYDDKLSAEHQQDIEVRPAWGVWTGAQGSCCRFASGVSACRARTLCQSSWGQLSVENRDCERMRVQIAHTRVALDEADTRVDSASSTTQLKCGNPRTCATGAAKIKQSYLWRLEICDVRINYCEARAIQHEALGAARECLPKFVARLKHARPDDDAEDERDEEIVLDACFFPHRTASSGASPLRRRTERDVRKDSRGRGNISLQTENIIWRIDFRYRSRSRVSRNNFRCGYRKVTSRTVT